MTSCLNFFILLLIERDNTLKLYINNLDNLDCIVIKHFKALKVWRKFAPLTNLHTINDNTFFYTKNFNNEIILSYFHS